MSHTALTALESVIREALTNELTKSRNAARTNDTEYYVLSVEQLTKSVMHEIQLNSAVVRAYVREMNSNAELGGQAPSRW